MQGEKHQVVDGRETSGGDGEQSVDGAADFEVRVVDPVKQGDGVGAYVSYKVVSRVAMEGYSPTRHEVIRRFRDFTWLKNCLRKEYAGEGLLWLDVHVQRGKEKKSCRGAKGAVGVLWMQGL